MFIDIWSPSCQFVVWLRVTAAMANMLCNIILLVSFLAFEDLLLILHLSMHLACHRQVVEG